MMQVNNYYEENLDKNKITKLISELFKIIKIKSKYLQAFTISGKNYS